MRLLLDTHALLWWLTDDPKLPLEPRDAIANTENDIFVSSASAWEISTKHRIGKLTGVGDVSERLVFYVRKSGFQSLPISLEHAVEAGRLPGPHKDPFDRMLMAQANIEKLKVVTIDPVFKDYQISVLW
ncbi:MAG: type II toxin-antitoxin system VapC family toxin [Rhodospirillaceae bacterium]|jgi:PIN domain nuclease of toxin-antitoxin system|nr:type II toxin-antitoxin system VapC family toxin [Rhodospirillaceae bacterium]MBT7770106.1 type II toxin-antitoxin system VapC family toxin [Rhodospirillales bacterium]MBT4702552.1 type II toxin-antitoxin system VapC family toxin [Rhodospirillaceae bacterium]MBT5033728.1 type II toxin-antitoxin system VapC family toxin [Rhodospirillaceae bacterium]MBT6221908.1 type II toxin-antitoxin system VapC family toxin [Rhodospirillaceae bacterium]